MEMSRTTGEIFTDQEGVCCAIPFAYIYIYMVWGGTAWGGPAQCRIQDFTGDVDLKNCQTAQTPLMNSFYCIFKLQFEKNTKFM